MENEAIITRVPAPEGSFTQRSKDKSCEGCLFISHTKCYGSYRMLGIGSCAPDKNSPDGYIFKVKEADNAG